MNIHRLHTHTTVMPWIMAGVLITGLLPVSRASARARPGGAIFAVYCASCRGISAKGDGPRCQELMSNVHVRLAQEIVRLGGHYAHVHAETIDARHDDAAGEAWLHGCFSYMLYRRPSPSS